MHSLWAKIGWVSIFLKNRFQIDSNDLNLRVAKCIVSKSTRDQQYTRQPPSTSNAYVSTPMHTLRAKIDWVSIFLKNSFQLDANDLNLRVAKCIISKSTPHQQHTRQQPSTSNAYLSTPMHTLWAKIGWVSIFSKKLIPNWRKWPQFESCQMYILKIYSSSTIHQTTSFNLKCIFVHSHAHPLSKNWLSQHIFKKQIPTWRKWPQFDSYQMYIFKIYSSSTLHQTTTFNLKCIFVHSHAHPLSKNWLSQYIFKKLIPNWRKWPQFESCQMYILKIYYSSTIHQATTFNLKCIFVHSPAHPLSKNWVSQHIFKKQIPTWHKWPQFDSYQMYIFKIYSSSTIHQATTFNLKGIFLHSHAHPLSKNWMGQHIFKKTDSKLTQMTSIWELPNVYFENLLLINNTPGNNFQPQMHICPLPCTPFEQKLDGSAYFQKKMIPNWRKWPQFESYQMYIFKIYSSSTTHQTTTFNLKCIFVHSHAHPLSKNWMGQHIFKKTDSKLTQMTSIWELPNVYFENLLLINNTPDNILQPQMHICPLPCAPFEQKLAESAYF